MHDHNEDRIKAAQELVEKVGPELGAKIQASIEQLQNQVAQILTQATEEKAQEIQGLDPVQIRAVLNYCHLEMIDFLMHAAGHHAANEAVPVSEFVWAAAEAWDCCVRFRLRQQSEQLRNQVLGRAAKQYSENN